LERIYQTLNRQCYIHPDPLEFLYRYSGRKDREIVGLIASSLAYGRVALILKSVEDILCRMGTSPHLFIKGGNLRVFRRSLSGFSHRFATSEHMAQLFSALKKVIERNGSLQRGFLKVYHSEDETVLPALHRFFGELSQGGTICLGHLVPNPAKGSACKRLNLFLRWMVRHDEVDPGGWADISPAKLIIPLDVHIFRFCRGAGMTGRRQPDMTTALEITREFRKFSPEDPVRYDFALSRLGIRKDMGLLSLFRRHGAAHENSS
jgi:uncharacterized protein (TIGR02757 family)